MKKKIMFIYLKTGGGHVAPANAISNYLLEHNSDKIETVLVDGLAGSSWYAKLILEKGYRFLQNKAEWLYEVIYFFHKFRLIAKFSGFLVTQNTQTYIRKRILEEQPDLIVLLHFFMIEPVYVVLEKRNLNTKVITIVTDPYTAHPLWFIRKNLNYILFSEKLKRKCIADGIAESNIKVFSFVINSKFSSVKENVNTKELRTKHGFGDGKIVLLLGGADGIRNAKKIVNAIVEKSSNYEIAVVCGKNTSLFAKMNQLKSERKLDSLKVFGFVDFVYELINVSDVVVTKCGASTISEILLSGKIPFINRYLWEQEKGNVEFVVENKFGIYEKDIDKLAINVDELFRDERKSEKYLSNIKSAGLRNGLEEVAGYIKGLLVL